MLPSESIYNDSRCFSVRRETGERKLAQARWGGGDKRQGDAKMETDAGSAMWATTKLYVAKGRVRSWKKVLHLECNDSTGLGVLAAHVEGKLSYGNLGE